METTHQDQDLFNGPPGKLPGMLNTLTILTFIGCAISYIGGIWNFFRFSDIEKRREEIDQAREKMGDNSFGAKMMDSSMELIEKSYDYRYILLIGTLLFTTLCLVGAMQMRKLKKGGYPLYLVGEIAPVIMAFVIMGVNLTTGFGALIAVIFSILYTTQRKYLVHA